MGRVLGYSTVEYVSEGQQYTKNIYNIERHSTLKIRSYSILERMDVAYKNI